MCGWVDAVRDEYMDREGVSRGRRFVSWGVYKVGGPGGGRE